MNLGDILVAKGLVTRDQVEAALEHQKENGGRIGASLIVLGHLTQEQLDGVIRSAPPAPLTLEETGLNPMFTLTMVIKGMYRESIETASRLAEQMMMPVSMINKVLQDAKDRKLVEALGASGTGALAEMRYSLTRAGHDWAVEATEKSQYFGPAPVTPEAFQQRVVQQRITNEVVTRDQLVEAFKGLVIPDRFLSRLGPAVNSGNPILIYGPAGNGKTTVAEIVGKIFQDVVYVPYCVEIDGEIMKVYDPTIHQTVEGLTGLPGETGVRRGPIDTRWVPCFRPMVVTGGELAIESFDLKFNSIAKFYEAPLHIKALNGTFLIDDFGRQRAKPEDILNRWIVPMNSKVDYLTLHTGKTVQIPFDEMIIFSTNLHPDDLMDPAFQRRISYKLETIEPPEDLFRKVFADMAEKKGLHLTDDIYQQVVEAIRAHDAPLAYFQPKFIVDQVLSSCKFDETKPQFTKDNVDDALSNLFVKTASKMFGVKR